MNSTQNAVEAISDIIKVLSTNIRINQTHISKLGEILTLNTAAIKALGKFNPDFNKELFDVRFNAICAKYEAELQALDADNIAFQERLDKIAKEGN